LSLPSSDKHIAERVVRTHLSFTPLIVCSIPLYTLYGHLLEDYHRDGRGSTLITQLYEQKRSQERARENTAVDSSCPPSSLVGTGTPAAATPTCVKYCGKGIDLQLVSQVVEVERRRGNHEQALVILQETFDVIQSEKIRRVLSSPSSLSPLAHCPLGVCTLRTLFKSCDPVTSLFISAITNRLSEISSGML
jgi:hypothetical protein